jgi:transcriptional regulator with XRE-family HTH domain
MHKLITKIRESKGMNQAEFAEAIGISEAQLSRLENNKRQPGRKALAGLFSIASGDDKQRLEDAILEAAGIAVVKE